MKQNDSKNQNTPRRSPGTVLAMRGLAALVVLYMLWQTVSAYLAGGEDAPSVGMLVLSIVVLGGGALFIGFLGYREWKQATAAEVPAEETPDSSGESEPPASPGGAAPD